MADTDVQKMMQYDANKKSVLVAYLLWFLVGVFGMHRFYLEKKGTGAAILVITLLIITIPISVIWCFVDLFLIPGRDGANLQQQLGGAAQRLKSPQGTDRT